MKYSVSVDRLKLCYTVSTTFATEIANANTELNFGGYKISPEIKTESPHDKTYNIQLYYPTTKGDWMDYATMSLGSKLDNEDTLKKDTQYIWIELNNKILYTSTATEKKQNMASYIYDITDSLSFKLNNITRLEIAYDSYKNMATRIKKKIMSKNTLPIVNGKGRYDVNKVIDEVLYIRTGNQLRYKTLSVYIKPKADKKISFRAYDKGCEITKTKKKYVKEYIGMTDSFFRAEIALQNEPIREYLIKHRMDIQTFLEKIISSEAFREEIFTCFSNRLLRFRTNEGITSILDL